MKTNFKLFTCAVALMGLLGTSAQADVLTDGNSTVTINPTSSAGISDWTVNGIDQLNRDWFFVRANSGGAASSIDSFVGTITTIQNTPSSLTTTYLNNQFSLSLVYSLLGGTPGSGSSQLSIQYSIHNLSTAGALTLYNYGDFSLGGGTHNVQLGTDVLGKFNEALLTAANGNTLDVNVTSGANEGETQVNSRTLANFASGTALGGNLSTLNTNGTFAFGWTVNSGQTVGGSKVYDLNTVVATVPDPAQWFLILVGLGSCVVMARYLPKMERRLAVRRISNRR